MNRPVRARSPIRGALAVGILIVLLLSTWAPASSQETADGSPSVASVAVKELEWWPLGRTEIGEGFHLRIPITVTNPRDHAVTNGAVLAELDLTRLMIDAGWVRTRQAGLETLRSFHLDENSIRVVSMLNLEHRDQSISGAAIHDRDAGPRGDPIRNVVPSTYYTGSLTDEAARSYDPASNPLITVLWRVDTRMSPGAERHFVIYFDSMTNSLSQRGHDPIDHTPIRDSGLMEMTYGPGPGTDLLGFVNPDEQWGQRNVFVVGLQDETQVQVLLADTRTGTFRVQTPPAGTHENPFTIGRDEIRSIYISNQHTHFRLLADKPILALVHSEGYVPDRYGSLVGDEFLFATTPSNSQLDAQGRTQDSVFFLNRHPEFLLNPATTDAATIVELDRIDEAGQTLETQTIHLSGTQNDLPYTLGARDFARFASGGCMVNVEPNFVAQVNPNARYRATVVEGGPVALQMLPVIGASQIPAIDGAPRGSEFWSALSRTQVGANCGEIRQASLFAASPDPAHLETTSPERGPDDPRRLFPNCTGNCPDPGREIGLPPDAALTGQTTETDRMNNRPIRIGTTGPAWLFVDADQSRDTARNVPLRGPLMGADGAREFAGMGPSMIHAPYRDTRIEYQIHTAQGLREGTMNMPAGDLRPLRHADEGIAWYTLNANRPIVVLPQGAQPGVLASVPTLLEATLHDVDYRGHLVDIRPRPGTSLGALTLPGESAEYVFDVTNLGRAAYGENLPDVIDLSHTEPPEGWTVRIEPPRTPRLDSGQSQTVRMFVTPDEDMPTGEIAQVRIQATSDANPNVHHRVHTSTHIESVFDLRMWFEREAEPGQPDCERNRDIGPFTEKRVHPGEFDVVRFLVCLENRGSEEDTIRLETSLPDTGWENVFVDRDTGIEVLQKRLQPREVASLELRVEPPSGLEFGSMLSRVTAQSLGEPAVSREINAQTLVSPPADLSMEVEEPVQWVAPGEEARFDVHVHNEGGPANVVFGLQHDAPDDWSGADVILLPPGDPDDRANATSVLGRDSRVSSNGLSVQATITVPENATADDRVALRVNAATASGDDNLEAFLFALVRPVHQLNVTTPPLPLHVSRGGEAIPLELSVANEGNLDERLRPTIATIPSGWSLRFHQEELFLPLDLQEDSPMHLEIEPPAGIPEGQYVIEIDLVSREGNRTRIELPVVVGTFLAHHLTEPGPLLGQPGRTLTTEYVFENQGNSDVTLSLERHDEEAEAPWGLAELGTSRLVPPRAQVAIPVAWEIARDAPDGSLVPKAVLVIQPESPDVETVRRTLEAQVEIGRPDLHILEASVHPGASGDLVRVLVGNQGEHSAHDVIVELRVAGEAVDHVRINEIAPDATRNLTLLQPLGRDGNPTIVIDPDNQIEEVDKTNNVYTVSQDEAADAPGITVGVLLAATLLLGRIYRQTGSRLSRSTQGDMDGPSIPSPAARRIARQEDEAELEVHTVRIQDPLGEEGPTLEEIKLQAGESQVLHLADLDEFENLVPGTGARFLTLIVVQEASGDQGRSISSFSAIPGGAVNLHASGYDANGNYIEDVEVQWKLSLRDLGTLAPDTGPDTTFTGSEAGTGILWATHHNETLRVPSIAVTVESDEVHRVEIRRDPGSTGRPLGLMNAFVGQAMDLHAVAFNAEGTSLGGVQAQWQVEPSTLCSFEPATGATTTFLPEDKGTGTITVTRVGLGAALGRPRGMQANMAPEIPGECVISPLGFNHKGLQGDYQDGVVAPLNPPSTCQKSAFSDLRPCQRVKRGGEKASLLFNSNFHENCWVYI